MKKLKILTVFGTRPEVIKLAPFIKVIEDDLDCISITCATTQHRELQNGILDLFKIIPSYDLDIMVEGQDLFYITSSILEKIKIILEKEIPDYVVVHGDTTTAFASALAGFYKKIPIIHIEAGLRTGNIYSPFPEEANRSLISKLAKLHMAPTLIAVNNLAKEDIVKNVFMVGNTIVDSVRWVLDNCLPFSEFVKEKIKSPQKKILITVHRRENFGNPLINICAAVKNLCNIHSEYRFVWPVHPNPSIRDVVYKCLTEIKNLDLIEPLIYSDLLLFINSCSLILSDSGGIQEEACILGKKIIILREDTERPEVVKAGFGVLAGADQEKIFNYFQRIIKNKDFDNYSLTNIGCQIYGMPGVAKNILLKIKEIDN